MRTGEGDINHIEGGFEPGGGAVGPFHEDDRGGIVKVILKPKAREVLWLGRRSFGETVEIGMVHCQSSRFIALNQNVTGRGDRSFDAKPLGEPAGKAGLARPEIAHEGNYLTPAHAGADRSSEALGFLGALAQVKSLYLRRGQFIARRNFMYQCACLDTRIPRFFSELLKILTQWDACSRIAQIGLNIEQWDQGKGALVQAGVRNDKSRLVDNGVAIQGNIDIYRARPPVLLLLTPPPQIALDLVNTVEQRVGQKGCFQFYGRVEKGRLVDLAPGGGFVNVTGAGEINTVSCAQEKGGLTKEIHSIAEIRAEETEDCGLGFHIKVATGPQLPNRVQLLLIIARYPRPISFGS